MGDTWHLKRAEELLGHRDPGSVGSQFDVRVATAEALVQIAQELHDLNERMAEIEAHLAEIHRVAATGEADA